MLRRYSIGALERIFSEANKYERWLKIEVSLLKYLSSRGIIDSIELNELVSELVVIPQRIRREEKKTNHDVVAFVNALASSTKSELKKWIHYGITSSDLVDTANSLMFRDANELLLGWVKKLLKKLKRLSYIHQYSFCLDRDGLEVNGATSFGYKLALHYEDIKLCLEALEQYRRNIEVASMSGSLGLFAHIGTDMQDFVALDLGLYSAEASTQVVSRGRYFRYFNLISSLLQSIYKLVLSLRFLSRTEIGEVAEGFFKEQVGSSSMPHKKNPITLENICGLCRLFNGYSSTLSKNINLWFERDISHSSVDRVVFLDALTVFGQVISRTYKVLQNLVVNKEKMKSNIEKNDYLVFKDVVRNALLSNSGYSEPEVDEFLNTVRKKSLDEEISFEKAFKSTNLVDFVGKNPDSLFDLETRFSYLSQLYSRIFYYSEQQSEFDSIYYEKASIDNAVEKIALQLNNHYFFTKEPVKLIAFREGCTVFLSNLLPKLSFPVDLKTVQMSLVKYLFSNHEKPLPLHLTKSFFKDNQVLIVDECISTGTSIKAFKKYISSFKPQEVKTAILFAVDRQSILKQVDFCGLTIPASRCIAGYGMDVGGKYRNYPFVGLLKTNHLP